MKINFTEFIKTNRDYILCLLVTVIIFHFAFSLSILNPSNISWLMTVRHDWGQVYLGWSFWRNEPWTFPLGKMENFIYPVGSNMGFTDCVPLMALICKPFSAILPEEFQYVGIWLLFCYFMVAHYTYKICRLYTDNIVLIIAAVVFVVANPVLTYRGMHPALCSHGFLLGSIYYYLVPATAQNVNSLNKKQLLLAFFIAIINPYMTAMVMVFNILLPLKHIFYNKLLTPVKGLLYFAASIVAVLVVWIAIGMLQFGGESLSVSGGYGLYSLNLNFLYNSSGFSKFLPQLPWVSPWQYEGFMYLGLGYMIFLVISLIVFFVSQKPLDIAKRNKWLLPLFIAMVLLFVFAVTNKITFNENVLAEIPLPQKVLGIFSLFRSSGRFFWPVFYILMLFSLVIFFRSKLPSWLKYIILVLTIALQAYDITPLYNSKKLTYGTYDSPLNEQKWQEILPQFTTMVTYPPFNNHLLNNLDYQDLCYVALKNNKPITTGYSARDNTAAYAAVTDSITTALLEGNVNPKDLYITTPQYVSAFGSLLHSKKVKMQYLDGYCLIYSNSAAVPVVTNDVRAKTVVDSINAVYTVPSFKLKITTPVADNSKIDYTIEEISMGKDNLLVKGWAYRKSATNNKGNEVYVTLTEGGTTYIANTNQIKRPDLTTFFKKENLEDSGYLSAFYSEQPWTQQTRLGLAIKGAGDVWTYADLGPLLLLNPNKKPDVLAKLPPAGKVMGNIDEQVKESKYVLMSGWAAFEDMGSEMVTIKMVFAGKNANYIINTAPVKREDVTTAKGGKYNYDNSGFKAKADITAMKKGTYQIGLLVSKDGREEIKMTDKTIEVK